MWGLVLLQEVRTKVPVAPELTDSWHCGETRSLLALCRATSHTSFGGEMAGRASWRAHALTYARTHARTPRTQRHISGDHGGMCST